MNTDDPFASLRSVPAEDSLSEVGAWIHRAESTAPPARSTSMRTLMSTRRLRLAGLGLAFVAACTMPVEQEDTYAVVLKGRIAAPPGEARAALERLAWAEAPQTTVLGEVTAPGSSEVLSYVASGKAIVNGRAVTTPTSTFAMVLPRSSRGDVEARERELRALPGVTSLTREQVEDTVRRPAYQAVLTAFEYRFDTRLSEAEVESRVQSHLGTLRGAGVTVRHVTRADGTREIQLSGPGQTSRETARDIDGVLREIQTP